MVDVVETSKKMVCLSLLIHPCTESLLTASPRNPEKALRTFTAGLKRLISLRMFFSLYVSYICSPTWSLVA